MPRFRFKEAALLILPIAALLGISTFWQNRQAALEREGTGPYRAAITRIEPVEVNSSEEALGFDAKIKIHVIDLGCRADGAENWVRRLTSDLQLVGRQGGQVRRFKANLQDGPLENDPLKHLKSGWHLALFYPNGKSSQEAREQVFVVLVRTSDLAPESEVRLEGPVRWKFYYGNLPNPASAYSHSAPLSYVIRRPN